MISKEQLADLPIRRYEGAVCLVTTSQDVERARLDFRQEKVVGFDTETRPSFRKGDVHLPCLVQAATARAVYLFQLRRMEVTPILHELLAEIRIVKAGVALDYDLRQLQQVFPFTVRACSTSDSSRAATTLARPACATSPGCCFASGFPRATAPRTGPHRNSRRRRSTTPPPMPGPAASCTYTSKALECFRRRRK